MCIDVCRGARAHTRERALCSHQQPIDISVSIVVHLPRGLCDTDNRRVYRHLVSHSPQTTCDVDSFVMRLFAGLLSRQWHHSTGLIITYHLLIM
jgi:hypothetical protein